MTNQDTSNTLARQGTSRPLLFAIAAALTLAAFTTAFAPTASAHAGEDTFTITAKESGCSGGKTYCLEATEGDLANVSAGDNVKIFFENPSSNGNPHSFNAALASDADLSGHDTSSDAAYAGSGGTVSPGDNATIRFQLPSGANGVYFWCDVGGHEQQGMWIHLDFTSSSDGGNGGDGQNGSPAPGLPALLAVLSLAAAIKLRD